MDESQPIVSAPSEQQPPPAPAATSAPTPQIASSASPPVAAAAVSSPKDKRIANGVRFLSDPRIKSTPISRRVNFLKSKGLSAEEIVESFEKAGQPQTLDAINSLISGSGAAAAAAAAQSSSPVAATAAPISGVYVPPPQGAPPPPPPPAGGYYSPPPQQYQQQQLYGQAMPSYQQPPQQFQHAPLPPIPTAPPPPPHPSRLGDKWKDYVIGAGAVALASWGAWKAFEAFSPIELRWKEGGAQQGGGPLSSRSLQRQGSLTAANGMNVRGSSRQQNLSTSNVYNLSSESEMEARAGSAPPRALPPTPLTSTKVSAPAAAVAAAVAPAAPSAEAAAQITEFQERIASLEKELTDTKACLDKDRREKAELAVSNGKLKGQVTNLGRQNDKNAAEVLRLSTELTNVKAELEKKMAPVLPSQSASTADEGAASSQRVSPDASAADQGSSGPAEAGDAVATNLPPVASIANATTPSADAISAHPSAVATAA